VAGLSRRAFLDHGAAVAGGVHLGLGGEVTGWWPALPRLVVCGILGGDD
jgi:hypothetical protein